MQWNLVWLLSAFFINLSVKKYDSQEFDAIRSGSCLIVPRGSALARPDAALSVPALTSVKINVFIC